MNEYFKDGCLLLSDTPSGEFIEEHVNALDEVPSELKKYIEDLYKVTEANARRRAELNAATQIQASMLPRTFPAFPDRDEFDIYATMTPAKEVCGDFYDFFLIDDDHLAVIIADVSGKGVTAALFMVIAKTLVKNHVQMGESPADTFTNANTQLFEDNEAGMFVTAWMGILEISSGKLTYVNAGHNPPLIRRRESGFQYLKCRPGFVLAGLEGTRYVQDETVLEAGEALFLYTDGVTEATDTENKLYGEGRLQQVLNENRCLPMTGLLPAVRADIDRFVRGAAQFDDITMLGLEVTCCARERRGGSLTVPAHTEQIPAVTETVESFIRGYKCSSRAAAQLLIAVDEIISNIVSYAYPDGDGEITVEYSAQNNYIVLRFYDSGVQFDPLSAADPDPMLSVEERGIGGLGIFMVKKSMDCVGYEYKDCCNILTIRKKI